MSCTLHRGLHKLTELYKAWIANRSWPGRGGHSAPAPPSFCLCGWSLMFFAGLVTCAGRNGGVGVAFTLIWVSYWVRIWVSYWVGSFVRLYWVRIVLSVTGDPVSSPSLYTTLCLCSWSLMFFAGLVT